MNIECFIAARNYFNAIGDGFAVRILDDLIDEITQLIAGVPAFQNEELIAEWWGEFVLNYNQNGMPAAPNFDHVRNWGEAERNARAARLQEYELHLALGRVIAYINTNCYFPYFRRRGLEPREVN